MAESSDLVKMNDEAIKGKRFTCVERCAMCCRLFRVPLFPDDLKRIEKSLNQEKEAFSETITDLESARVISAPPTNGQLVVLKTKNDGSCIFLDNATLKCTIYEMRPLACRMYPLRFYKSSDDTIEVVLDPMSRLFCGWNLPNGKTFSEKELVHLWTELEHSLSSESKK